MKNTIRCGKGVTLLELIMVMVIVGSLVGIGSLYVRETIDLWRDLSFRSDVVSQGRVAFMRMAREIRHVKNVSSVITATASQFKFTDVNDIIIEFKLTGSDLMRNIVGSSDKLTGNVTAVSFTYYDSTNADITSKPPAVSPSQTDIKTINIDLTIQIGTQAKTLRMRVFPRNL
jgi:prepilin-type N-terminal cleavage/methylation domain-containing protein